MYIDIPYPRGVGGGAPAREVPRYAIAVEHEAFLVAFVDRVLFMEPTEEVRACRDAKEDQRSGAGEISEEPRISFMAIPNLLVFTFPPRYSYYDSRTPGAPHARPYTMLSGAMLSEKSPKVKINRAIRYVILLPQRR